MKPKEKRDLCKDLLRTDAETEDRERVERAAKAVRDKRRGEGRGQGHEEGRKSERRRLMRWSISSCHSWRLLECAADERKG